MEAVDGKQVVLLHGPWQSGKTSALRFLQSRSQSLGQKVYYIDMFASKPALQQSAALGYSIFKFIAIEMFGLPSEQVFNFVSAPEFCRWIKSQNHSSTLPLLLIDEYDAFLQNCRNHKQFLIDINSLIAYCRNTQSTFQSIICAGTFSIIATQSEPMQDNMEIDDAPVLEKTKSDDSFDAVVLPFDDISSPWNKARFIETTHFKQLAFVSFSQSLYRMKGVNVEDGVIDDIWESTSGHPGFSMYLLVKSISLSTDYSSELSTIRWMEKKRSFYCDEIVKTPTMQKMLSRVKSTKKITNLLFLLVREKIIVCTDNRYVSFLRSVGIAKLLGDDTIMLACPIIRDALLQNFFPASDDILETVQIPGTLPINYALSILLKAIPYLKATQLLDPLVYYAKGLSEASIHAEIYRVLHSLFRNQPIRILTETRVVKDSDMRCDIWLKLALLEFGIEFKSEANTKEIDKATSGQILKYASSLNPREMILVNFVRKEEASVLFPIDFKPKNWEKHPDTSFSVLFVLVLGDIENGLKFRYALNGYNDWVDL